MGTDFALACGDCLEFIDLHKWSIVKYYSLSSFFLSSIRVPSLSNQPIVPVSDRQLFDSLKDYVPVQPYIEKLMPVVHDFITSHRSHFLFLTCDYGELPWDFGEPRYLEWKEVKGSFGYSGQFLPRNLIEDFGFTEWSEVLKYYTEQDSWFLMEQMREEREALRQAFEARLQYKQ